MYQQSNVLSSIRIFSGWFHMPIWKQIMLALFAGTLVGLLFGSHCEKIKPIGVLFINAIHMIVAPVVCTVIISAMVSISDLNQMRRISLKAIGVYGICMTCATLIGIVCAYVLNPGYGLQIDASVNQSFSTVNIPSINVFIEQLVPRNIIEAVYKGNILHMVVFSILFGLAIQLSGEHGAPIAHFFKSMSHVVFKLAQFVMNFAPYGIFALIADTIGKFGVDIFLALFAFIFTVYCACTIMLVCVYGLFLWILLGISPIKFFKRVIHALTFAYTTCSSAATLPLSIQCVQEDFKVSKRLSEFLLPLGASFNLNGLSIYLAVATVFAANIHGISLDLNQYLTVMMTTILVSMGVAAVPGSAIIVMSVIMSAVGIPLGAIGIIVSVDRINDMMQTTTNVAGDIFATLLIAKSEDEIR